MALDSWMTKVRSALDAVRSTVAADAAAPKRTHVGILAFEIASLMSKLVHLWRSLSDPSLSRLRHDAIALEGVRKVVSDDDAFLLGLAFAELADSLRLAADSLSAVTRRCSDPTLHSFPKAFHDFANSGRDPNRWLLSPKEMESKAKRMDRYVASTAALYKQMEELGEAEQGLRRLLHTHGLSAAAEAQQRIFWQQQQVKHLKQTSLWGCTLDAVSLLLARAAFTVLARIKHVFIGVGHEHYPLPRSSVSVSPSPSAAVYPSSEAAAPVVKGFFESSREMLEPPETTLGAAALALHYANVVMVMERMIRAPRAVGADAREELYGMLPARVRGLLRARLRGIGWGAARDGGLAGEWTAALGRIVGWLGPLAHNTVRWQAERSFERRSAGAPRGSVMVLQTLYFANREKVEAAVAELLVGLNYVWRFEMTMSAVEGLIQIQPDPSSHVDEIL